MLYSKHSLNYWLTIFFLRRLALFLIYITELKPKGILGQHIENARKIGIFKYLNMKSFIHRNTDGPLNPYSKVYSLKDVKNNFAQKQWKQFKSIHGQILWINWKDI